jgi:hypothetical protein
MLSIPLNIIFKSATNFDVKISIYENILKESVDTIQLVRDELKLDPVNMPLN